MKRELFVSGIGTGIGKTFIAAALVDALGADYWKPVQAGLEEGGDSQQIRLLAQKQGTIHPERYRLTRPMSPHAAAACDSVTISLSDFHLPETENHLVIEGAGGLMVPLNDRDLVIDLIAHLKVPVVLVAKHYLGSINHSLLSLEALERREIPLEGIVFVGDENQATEEAILSRTNARLLARIPIYQSVDSQAITSAGKILRGAFV